MKSSISIKLILLFSLSLSVTSYAHLECASFFSKMYQFSEVLKPLERLLGAPIKTTRAEDSTRQDHEARLHEVLRYSGRRGNIQALREAATESLAHGLNGEYGFVFKTIPLKALDSRGQPLEAATIVFLLPAKNETLDMEIHFVFGDYKAFEDVGLLKIDETSTVGKIIYSVKKYLDIYLKNSVASENNRVPYQYGTNGTSISYTVYNLTPEQTAQTLEQIVLALREN